MISCNQVQSSLEAYYDEECTPEERQALESHLASCPSCQSELDRWVSISRQLFPAQSVKAPPFLWTRVLAGIEAQESVRGLSSWWLQWRWMTGVTFAMSLFAIIVSAYWFQSATPTLDTLLEGETTQQEAIQLASAITMDFDQNPSLISENGTWAEN